jgi:hypothetical protein
MNQLKILKTGMIALAIAVGSFTNYVQAQPQEGNSELQLNADLFAPQGSSDLSASVAASYGMFITDELEVGIRQGYTGIFPSQASSLWIATTTPFIDYHFRGLSDGDTVLPYIGVFLGAVWNDRDITGTLGPNAGVKLFVNNTTFVNFNYRYEWFFDKFRTVGRERTDGNHVGQVGIGFLW